MARKRERASVWRDRVERWRGSGESAETFAQREGVLPRTLSWWASELKRRGEATSSKRLPTPSFLPIAIGASPYSGDGMIEIELRSGHLIRVERDFHIETLRRVVEAIGHR
jgi:hypothetical protein